MVTDFKMNGPYYAFQLLGESLGMGKVLMYIFAVVQAIFLIATKAKNTQQVLYGEMIPLTFKSQL